MQPRRFVLVLLALVAVIGGFQWPPAVRAQAPADDAAKAARLAWFRDAKYEPSVRRGWTALVKAIQPDGMLGWVQRIGDKPGATSQETTEVYGVGALLLAGSEVYRLAGGK